MGVIGANILFLASFHNNDTILSQFQVLIVLCESFVNSVTVFLPFYPTVSSGGPAIIPVD